MGWIVALGVLAIFAPGAALVVAGLGVAGLGVAGLLFLAFCTDY